LLSVEMSIIVSNSTFQLKFWGETRADDEAV
jgi:hypothetical protein